MYACVSVVLLGVLGGHAEEARSLRFRRLECFVVQRRYVLIVLSVCRRRSLIPPENLSPSSYNSEIKRCLTCLKQQVASWLQLLVCWAKLIWYLYRLHRYLASSFTYIINRYTIAREWHLVEPK